MKSPRWIRKHQVSRSKTTEATFAHLDKGSLQRHGVVCLPEKTSLEKQTNNIGILRPSAELLNRRI